MYELFSRRIIGLEEIPEIIDTGERANREYNQVKGRNKDTYFNWPGPVKHDAYTRGYLQHCYCNHQRKNHLLPQFNFDSGKPAIDPDQDQTKYEPDQE